MKKLLIYFLFLQPVISGAQNIEDSRTVLPGCGLRISLLTCTPGEELYSTFGHSAIRVVDSTEGSDLVFNYGTFDFDDPDFYKKFILGKLQYFVSIDSLPVFLWEYEYFNRGVTEQVLNLSCDQKNEMVSFLFNNAKEENKYYRYDFNYDNCTSRLRDIVEMITGKPLQTKNILPDSNTTFRTLIHDYLDKGGQKWSKLGIDILLGSPLDKKVTAHEAMFLPDYLMMAFDSATVNGEPLVIEKRILLPAGSFQKIKPFFSPTIIFGILFLILLVISLRHSATVFFRIFDFIFFLLLGLLGCLLLFMWFGTDHAMCKNNFNLLWALPVHLPVSFFVFSKMVWVKNYFRFILFYTIALLAAWYFLPQQMNHAILPVLGIILLRSLLRSK